MKASLGQPIVGHSNFPDTTTGELYLPDGSRYQRNADSASRGFENVIVTGTLELDQDGRHPRRLVETIRDPADPDRFVFLDWCDGEYTIVPQIEYRGRIYVPPSQSAGLVSHLTIPGAVRPCGRLNVLLSDLRATIREFMEISDRNILLIQSFILANWFPDLFNSVPYLWLIGPPGSAKTTLLRLLSCVCRRALLVGDIRAAALYQLVDSLDTTLFIDELEVSGSRVDWDILRLLRTGSTHGIPVVRNGRIYSTFGFKVICSRQLPEDMALTSRAIAVSILPSLKELKPFTGEEMRRIAEEFQPRLMMFRLMHYPAVRNSRMQTCNLDDMTPRGRQLSRVLAAPLEGNEQAQSDLIALLQEYDRETRIERLLEPEWLGVEALFGICHEQLPYGGRVGEMLMGGVADQINSTLKYRGEDTRLTARKAGAILKSLGIKSESLGNLGRGVRFTQPFRRTIHELARQLGIDRSHIATLAGLDHGYGGVSCPLCEEFGLTAGLRFVEPTPRQSRRGPPSLRIPLFDYRNHKTESV
jgi:hypothetical protein